MTLLEAMTVVVIIGILVAIGVTNYFVTSKKRALEASLMTNMRTLQIMLETYKVDWQSYPHDILELATESNNKKYNKSVTNPYTQKSGPVGTGIWAMDFIDPTDSGFSSQIDNCRGRVGYQPTNPNDPNTPPDLSHPPKYYLFGYDNDGNLIVRNNVAYSVTNGG